MVFVNLWARDLFLAATDFARSIISASHVTKAAESPFWDQPKVDQFYILLVLGRLGIKWLVSKLVLSCTLHICGVHVILQFLVFQSAVWLWKLLPLQFSFGSLLFSLCALVMVTYVVPRSC